VLVLDLSTVEFRWGPNRESLAALTAMGELVAFIDVPDGEDEAEAAFRALDLAAGTASVIRDSPDSPSGVERLRVCWYNPFTAQVAVGQVPTTFIFADRAPIALEAEGSIMTLEESPEGAFLMFAGRVLPSLTPSVSELTRQMAAYEA
jgi:hypothetical protein